MWQIYVVKFRKSATLLLAGPDFDWSVGIVKDQRGSHSVNVGKLVSFLPTRDRGQLNDRSAGGTWSPVAAVACFYHFFCLCCEWFIMQLVKNVMYHSAYCEFLCFHVCIKWTSLVSQFLWRGKMMLLLFFLVVQQQWKLHIYVFHHV